MPEESQPYGSWIGILALVSLACVIGMVWGEVTDHRLWTAACIGIVLVAYSFILLFLRRGGFTDV